ncbi:hypothetical protein [Photobacterium leiognathi]|uniref:hypothetical protein n=1 Tax=Photobacterium leiognathi TaxID=553611 RepID=UPI0027340A7A|nr:hypothetical protein [Photobacterium leiognathi]
MIIAQITTMQKWHYFVVMICEHNEISKKYSSREANNGYQIVGKNQAVDSEGKAVNVYGAGDPDTTKMKFMWLPSWLFNFLL